MNGLQHRVGHEHLKANRNILNTKDLEGRYRAMLGRVWQPWTAASSDGDIDMGRERERERLVMVRMKRSKGRRGRQELTQRCRRLQWWLEGVEGWLVKFSVGTRWLLTHRRWCCDLWVWFGAMKGWVFSSRLLRGNNWWRRRLNVRVFHRFKRVTDYQKGRFSLGNL